MVRDSAGRRRLPAWRGRGFGGFVFRTLRNERGSTVLEFGLSAMVLFSLVLGLMAIDLALFSYHYICDAAREGARYAMVRGSQCSTNGDSDGTQTNCPLATSAALQTYVRGLSLPGIVASNLTVATSWSANGTTWTTTPGSNNAPGDLVKVVVTYQYPLSIPHLAKRTLSMSSTSQVVIAD